ncbi:hypothetical protein K469DRAFT_738399 [Zopfia rhizophila CBS 207.26]|uniref:Rhodopsin domain-containing protein n=1 Tax=Zopfia rhizophila CBS 207.26 TaxID=1314779 RepID=A0A6A6E9L0_9PEZI|nr:hypothetical protein K469DRAFT_738399 [Zopfia rhizophila CBS 207.26]
MGRQRGCGAIVTSGIFVGLATITVLLRLWTRFFIVRCPGIEDCFITLAMVEYGMGQHIWTLTPKDMTNSLKAFWASLIVYYLSLGLTKTSIILQYRRVFTTKKFHIACWMVMAAVVVYTVWTVFGSIFACVPVRAFWTREPASCINQFAMWFTNAAINILTDFVIIVLPMPVIKNLKLAKRQKQALMCIFAVGGFVCVVSILRLQSLVAISNSEDPTFDNPPAATWSSVETNVGIICSCLPCLRPLLAKCLPDVFSSSAQCSANSATPHSGSKYGRQSNGLDTTLASIDSKYSQGSSIEEKGDDRIQVVTVVDVRVEDSKQHRHTSDWRATELQRDSTGTPIRDVEKAVEDVPEL